MVRPSGPGGLGWLAPPPAAAIAAAAWIRRVHLGDHPTAPDPAGHTVDLAEVLGPAGRRLAEQLRDTPTWAQRFALLDGFLLRRLADGPRPAPETDWAWQRLVASGGAVPIGQLASEVGWSHRHLIARFRQQVGLTPKTAARLVRFDRVWRRLDQPQPLDWADLAREAGYADQAHLIREFHRFTGTTPTAFPRRGEVNSVQDAAAVAS
jgi:AraC-like DNA-binding protein